MKRCWTAVLLSAVLLAGCTISQPESSSGQSSSEKTDSPEEPAFQAETESENSTDMPEVDSSSPLAVLASLADGRSEEEILNANPYNKEIVYRNGQAWRLSQEGLEKHGPDSTEWTLVYDVSGAVGQSIDIYDHYLYFLRFTNIEDADTPAASKTLCRFDLDGGTCEELMETGDHVLNLTIYDSVLYFHIAGSQSAMRYEGWKLNSAGEPETQLDESSPEFVCRLANEYQYAEEHSSAAGLPREALSTPDCALLLNGCILFSEPNDEISRNYYVSYPDGSGKTLLFPAYDLFLVTEEGIYYWAEPSFTINFYSFSTNESSLFFTFPEAVSATGLTYDEDWLYGYTLLDEYRYFRISRASGELEYLDEYNPEELPWYSIGYVDQGILYLD